MLDRWKMTNTSPGSFGILSFFILFALGSGSTTIIPSYKGSMRVPIDLITSDGIKLPQGIYELEVKSEHKDHTLVFSQAGQTKAKVASIPADDADATSAHLPLVGTHYLRSTADPLLTAQERQHSKTGRAQYEEEDRDWKAALRTYRSSDKRAIFFIFQSRRKTGQWTRVNFKLCIPASHADR